jgi:hypothetical protein
MDEEQVVSRRVSTTPVTAPYGVPVTGEAVTTTRTTRSPSGAEVLRRVVVFVFALIQAVIALRLVLLLIDASRSNDIVQGIYSVSSWFVGPFEGILKTNAVNQGGAVLDVAAVVALVGWTIVELIVVAAINIARREP